MRVDRHQQCVVDHDHRGCSRNGQWSVSYIVAANTGAARTGTIAIGGQTFTVNQAAAPTCSYSLAASSADVRRWRHGIRERPRAWRVAWTATTSASWITITAGAIGASNGSVSFTVRRIPVRANRHDDHRRPSFTVNQAAAPPPPPPPSCTYTIAPTSESIAAAGGAGTAIAVRQVARARGPPSAMRRRGSRSPPVQPEWDGSVSFTVAANTGVARTGTMTIAGQTFTLPGRAAATTTTTELHHHDRSDERVYRRYRGGARDRGPRQVARARGPRA